MAYPKFEPITDMTMLYPRDYELYDPSVLTSNSNPLIGGEWLRQRIVGSVVKVERPSGTGLETNELCGPWWGEQSRYDVLAFKGVPILWLYDFEAFTSVVNTTGLSTSGQFLSVSDVTVDGVANRRGLIRTVSGAPGTLIVGNYVSPGRRTGEIRFVRRCPRYTIV